MSVAFFHIMLELDFVSFETTRSFPDEESDSPHGGEGGPHLSLSDSPSRGKISTTANIRSSGIAVVPKSVQ